VYAEINEHFGLELGLICDHPASLCEPSDRLGHVDRLDLDYRQVDWQLPQLLTIPILS
jgi:hypothetical protein